MGAVDHPGGYPRVVAVVVTFNRLELLQRLVRRLGDVSGLAEVVVVDNASTDGTGAWLDATAATGETPMVVHHLETNRGGAGGFHDGLALFTPSVAPKARAWSMR